jgi:hypothetical protein
MTLDDVIARLEAETKGRGKQKEWADKHGFRPQFVNAVLKGYAKPSGNILHALGFRRVVSYEPIEVQSRSAGKRASAPNMRTLEKAKPVLT